MNVNTVLAVVGIAASLIGIPATYYFARRSRQQPLLKYLLDFDVLLNPLESHAAEGALTFGGRSIARLSRTYVAIWNERGDTVGGSDVVGSDSLRIALAENDEFLQARVVYVSRRQCGIQVHPSGEFAEISFDFLDQGDGGLIEVIHQGSTSPTIDGTIRGAMVRRRRSR